MGDAYISRTGTWTQVWAWDRVAILSQKCLTNLIDWGRFMKSRCETLRVLVIYMKKNHASSDALKHVTVESEKEPGFDVLKIPFIREIRKPTFGPVLSPKVRDVSPFTLILRQTKKVENFVIR
jgi:hypothetical protein